MNGARRVNLSAASFTLICFFLPWIQAGCDQSRDSASGFDLARHTRPVLWLIPLMMFLVFLLGLMRFISDRIPSVYALSGTVGGGLSAFLMYKERTDTGHATGIFPLEWTVWYWLGLASSILVFVAAFIFYFKRSRSP